MCETKFNTRWSWLCFDVWGHVLVALHLYLVSSTPGDETEILQWDWVWCVFKSVDLAKGSFLIFS